MKSIISFLIFILEGVARALTFLLTSLGLWIPALFSLLFVLICAITKTPFGEVAGFFYVGLTLTFLLSVGICVHQVLKNKVKKHEQRGGSKKRVDKVTGKSKKRRKEEESMSVSDSAYVFTDGNNLSNGFDSVPQGYVPPQSYVQPQNYAQQPPQSYVQPQNYAQQPQQSYVQPQNYAQQSQQSYVQPQNYAQQPQQSYVQPQNYAQQPQQNYVQPQNYAQQPQQGYNQSSYNYNTEFEQDSQPKRSLYEEAKADFAREFGGYNKPQEYVSETATRRDAETENNSNRQSYDRPLVFRTRSDPNVLIYEYPDKYVFYRKNYSGNLEYIKTENK